MNPSFGVSVVSAVPHQHRHEGSGRSPRGSLVASLGVVAILITGCGTQPPSAAPSLDSGGQATLGPSATTEASATPKPSATPALAGLTFPPSQTPIEPGTYRWDGFERPVSLTLRSGWEIGHDNPAFFDLFRGSDFPSVTFARFTEVYVDRTHGVVARDAELVKASLLARTDLTLSTPFSIVLGGLTGWQFDLTTLVARTPLFIGPAGIFQLDPEFVTRYRVLDFPGGGVLVIGVHARADAFDAGVALGDPVVATLTVEP